MTFQNTRDELLGSTIMQLHCIFIAAFYSTNISHGLFLSSCLWCSEGSSTHVVANLIKQWSSSNFALWWVRSLHRLWTSIIATNINHELFFFILCASLWCSERYYYLCSRSLESGIQNAFLLIKIGSWLRKVMHQLYSPCVLYHVQVCN